MNTLAPELSALMTIFRSTGPVISTLRSCRSFGIGATVQSPSRISFVSGRKSGRRPSAISCCRATLCSNNTRRRSSNFRASSARKPIASRVRISPCSPMMGPLISTPAGARAVFIVSLLGFYLFLCIKLSAAGRSLQPAAELCRDSPRASASRLELESQAHLHRPHAARAADPAELRAADVAVRTSQVDVVQRIEHLGAELELFLLRDHEGLRQGKLDVPGAGSADQALAGSPGTDGHALALIHRDKGKRRRVDILDIAAASGAASAGLKRLLQDSVSPDIVGAAMVRVRAILGDEDRAAAARREDPRDLPASERVPQRGKTPIL